MGMDIYSVLDGSSSSGKVLIPVRDPGSVPGSVFVHENIKLAGAIREKNILEELLHGNIPDFLRKFVPITITHDIHSITYLVMPDVLSIGHDNDYVRVPMNPLTAQAVADQFDCTLPTKKMVNDIWKAAINKLAPLPWGPPYDASMISTDRFNEHNKKIQAQLIDKDYSALTSGHKKDVVLANSLFPNNPKKRVAIYGWIQLNGQPIQGLNAGSHENTYEDYSHGIRLIAKDVIVNGEAKRIDDIFSNGELSVLVSDEGLLKFTRY